MVQKELNKCINEIIETFLVNEVTFLSKSEDQSILIFDKDVDFHQIQVLSVQNELQYGQFQTAVFHEYFNILIQTNQNIPHINEIEAEIQLHKLEQFKHILEESNIQQVLQNQLDEQYLQTIKQYVIQQLFDLYNFLIICTSFHLYDSVNNDYFNYEISLLIIQYYYYLLCISIALHPILSQFLSMPKMNQQHIIYFEWKGNEKEGEPHFEVFLSILLSRE